MRENFTDYGINLTGSWDGEMYTTCPKCSSSRKKKDIKCLGVNYKKGVWRCNHCGWGGTLKEIDENRQKFIEERKTKYSALKHTWRRLDEDHRKYLNDRGITDTAISKMFLRTTDKYFAEVKGKRPSIVIPLHKNGNLDGIKYRTLDKLISAESGSDMIAMNYKALKDNKVIIITEGEIDLLTFISLGFDNVISPPNGAPPPSAMNIENSYKWVDDTIKNLEMVIIAVDGDDAGMAMRDNLAKIIGHDRCYYIEYPDGTKDINEVLTQYGAEKVADIMLDVKPIPLENIVDLHSIEKDLDDDFYGRSKLDVKLTGWTNFDQYMKIKSGLMTIITGSPSSGKSEFLNNICVKLAMSYDWKIAYYSPENFPYKIMARKLIEVYTGEPFNDSYSYKKMSDETYNNAKKWVSEHFYGIKIEDDPTLDNIFKYCKPLISKRKINGLIIDPWNELDHSRKKGMTETEHISYALTKIRKFAREYNIHIWVIAHPAKLLKDKNGEYKKPDMYSIAGSAHFYNKADYGMSIHRTKKDGREGVVVVDILKVRFKEHGKRGFVNFDYKLFNGRYYESDTQTDTEANSEYNGAF